MTKEDLAGWFASRERRIAKAAKIIRAFALYSALELLLAHSAEWQQVSWQWLPLK